MRFVLVHGAYHGPWCWSRLIPELERRGHEPIAVDLPIGDPETGAAEYADVIAEAVAGEDTVVVGHSLSGLAIPLVVERRRPARLVFLCAFLPRPGMSFNELRKHEKIEPELELQSAEFTDLGDGSWMIGPNTATELFYHDVPADDTRWAASNLRPQAYRITSEVTPLKAWPDAHCSYILCRDDRVIDVAWARAAARDRLGTVAMELEGGHSPFLTRPNELADALDRVVAQE